MKSGRIMLYRFHKVDSLEGVNAVIERLKVICNVDHSYSTFEYFELYDTTIK